MLNTINCNKIPTPARLSKQKVSISIIPGMQCQSKVIVRADKLVLTTRRLTAFEKHSCGELP